MSLGGLPLAFIRLTQVPRLTTPFPFSSLLNLVPVEFHSGLLRSTAVLSTYKFSVGSYLLQEYLGT
eukprot:SAG31_NODE_1475_length_8204_cov_18.026280_1_plen_66_part_00